MTSRTLCLLAAFMGVSSALAQTEAQVAKLLQKLKSKDIDTRLEAIQALQTSLDPRIPEACLPALQTEGDSIKRLAARAIGSRWHQIPQERAAIFMQALKPHLESPHEGLVSMAHRGLALLGRDYTDEMVSRSKSKRWVIYERHGLPCVIDTENSTEELLGFKPEGSASFSPAWGNGDVAPATFWHSKQDMVALDMLYGRKGSAVWIWRPGLPVRELGLAEVAKALGLKEDAIAPWAGYFTEIKGWKSTALTFAVDYSVIQGEDQISHSAELRWDSATDVITVLSDKKL